MTSRTTGSAHLASGFSRGNLNCAQPSNRYPVEPVRVVDQTTVSFGEDGVVRGRPKHVEPGRDPSHGDMVEHERFQCPPQPTARDLRACWRGLVSVLPPDLPAAGALVTADAEQQRCGPVAERLIHEPTNLRVPRHAFRAALPAHESSSTTRHSSTARSGSSRCPTATRPRSSRRQNVVRSGRAKVGWDTSRSFGMVSVGTSILRETSTPTRPPTRSTSYTLVREEPSYVPRLVFRTVSVGPPS